MNEEDTFHRLRRIPFDQVLDIACKIQDDCRKYDWYHNDDEFFKELNNRLREYTGWTWVEWNDEDKRLRDEQRNRNRKSI